MVAGGKDGEHLAVATTRPETILGDTAVCVHPEVKLVGVGGPLCSAPVFVIACIFYFAYAAGHRATDTRVLFTTCTYIDNLRVRSAR